MGGLSGEPRQKKKRQLLTKKPTSNELTNEYELHLERMRSQLELIPLPRRNCEDYCSFDKQVANSRHVSHLPDRPDEPFLNGNKLGDYHLAFLQRDYYERIEELLREEVEVDEEQRAWDRLEDLMPPTMAEICASVDMDALLMWDLGFWRWFT